MNYSQLVQARLHSNIFCSFINKTTLFAARVAKHLKETLSAAGVLVTTTFTQISS